MDKTKPVVRHSDDVPPLPCPFGTTRRVITGGEGGVANVHVISVTQGKPHYHSGYDEVYYFLKGKGALTVDGRSREVREGTAAVIPRGCVHSLSSGTDEPLQFVIVGIPAMSADDPRFSPRKPQAPGG